MWILVFIWLEGTTPRVVEVDLPFVDMFECFAAREMLSSSVGGENGYFPRGMQAVCIPTQDDI